MKPVDWRQLLAEHGVASIDRGPNVKRNEINIKCPFCGSADPSFHMGLNLETGFWSCWRNRAAHSGKSPLRLLVQLLGIPYWKARKIAGLTETDWLDPDGFDAVAARIMGRLKIAQVEHVKREFLQFPRDFISLGDVRTAGDRYWDYMRDERGFGLAGTQALISDYHLQYALRGDYKGRVIIPYYMDGELIAWTGRAIGPASIRYRDLERDSCLVPIKETLFNYDCIAEGGRVLVVQEGPIDALKVDVFGKEFGVRSVGLSTNSVSDEQIYLLEEASEQFATILVVMDTSGELSIGDSMRMKGVLGSIKNVKIGAIPYGLKDGGELSPRQATRWARELATGAINE